MAPDPPALKLRRALDSPLLLVGGPNCLQILVDQFKPLLARRLEAGDAVGQRVESLPLEVGYLPLYEREDVLERDKLHGCQAQAASPRDEQGQHQQREDDPLPLPEATPRSECL